MATYRISTTRAMVLTAEVMDLMMQGKNPYDYLTPNGPLITTVEASGTR